MQEFYFSRVKSDFPLINQLLQTSGKTPERQLHQSGFVYLQALLIDKDGYRSIRSNLVMSTTVKEIESTAF